MLSTSQTAVILSASAAMRAPKTYQLSEAGQNENASIPKRSLSAVMDISTFLAANKLFVNCRRLEAFENVITLDCCLNGEFKSCISSKIAPSKSASKFCHPLMFHLDNPNINHTWPFCLFQSNCHQMMNFSGHIGWQTFRENTVEKVIRSA